jgi:hypothetical protein
MTGFSAIRARRDDGGQSAGEYLGLIVGVALIIGLLAPAGFGDQITRGLQSAICRIMGDSCSVPAAISHVPRSCTTSSEARNVNAEVTVMSVKVNADTTLTLTRSVDRDGTVKWAVEEARSGGIGLVASAPEAHAGVNGVGAGDTLEGSISLTGSGGRKFEFDSEEAARDFLTTATHQIAKDAVVASNPLTSVGPIRSGAMWLLDQIDGRSYNPPPPSETFVDGGLKVAGTADLKAGAAGLNVSGSAAGVLGVKQDHDKGTTTWYVEASSDFGAQLGLAAGAGTKTVVGIEYDDATGAPVSASLSVSGELSGGLALSSPKSATTLSDLTTSAGLKAQSGVYGTAEINLDLTNQTNRTVFADALHSVGLPLLRADGSAQPPPVTEAVADLYRLFDTGAPGTTFGVVQYAKDEAGVTANAGAGLGVKFGIGGGVNRVAKEVAQAAYYEPGRGLVPWVQCSQ